MTQVTGRFILGGLFASAWVAACGGVAVDPAVAHQPEADGSCAIGGQERWADGLCHLGPERDGGLAGGGAGGASGGGAGGGSGGADAGAPDAGCAPTTCAAKGYTCGAPSDGCGGTLSCGTCDATRFESCGGGGVPSACGRKALCSVDGWCWENPLPQGNTLRAVWVSGPSDVWAAGDRGTVVHWDGEAWSGLHVPGAQSRVTGVAAFGGDVWVTVDTRILRWNGSTWLTEHTGAAPLNALAGTSPTDLYVVGTELLLSRQTGGSWTPRVLDAGNLALPPQNPVALTVPSPGLVYCAGPEGRFRYVAGDAVPVYEPMAIGGSIQALVGGAGGVVHGFSGGVPVNRSDAGVWQAVYYVALRVDGGTVVSTSFPWTVRALAARSPTDLWAVGDLGAQARLVAGVWTEVSPPVTLAPGVAAGVDDKPTLRAASASGGELWAVGENGTTWRLDGGALRRVSGGHHLDLNAATATSSGAVFATGELGVVLRLGQVLARPSTVCGGDGLSITSDTDGMLYLGTSTGMLCASDGGAGFSGGINPVTSASANPLVAVVGPAPLYVVPGGASVIARGVAPGPFEERGDSLAGSLVSAWRRPDRAETWVAGADATWVFDRDDGGARSDFTTGGGARAIFGVPAAGGGYSLWVAGVGGLLAQRLGPSLSAASKTTGTAAALLVAHATGVDRFLVAGSDGALLEWNGSAAIARESGTDHELRGLAAAPDGGTWAVGVGGAVLFHP